jgi:hypothetical protein
MGAGTHFKVDVWFTDAHLSEKHFRESFIIVLTGVHEQWMNFLMLAHFAEKRCNLDKIGSGTHHVEDLHIIRLPWRPTQYNIRNWMATFLLGRDETKHLKKSIYLSLPVNLFALHGT